MRLDRLPEQYIPADVLTYYNGLWQGREPGFVHASQYRWGHAEERKARIVALAKDLAEREGLTTCLEVGCCEGIMTQELAVVFGQVTAVDIVPAFIRNCPALPNVAYAVRDIEHWTPGGSFGLIVVAEVLEHLREPAAAVRRLVGHCRYLLASCPISEELNPDTCDASLFMQENKNGDAAGHLWAMDMEGFASLFAGLEAVYQEEFGPTGIVMVRGEA